MNMDDPGAERRPFRNFHRREQFAMMEGKVETGSLSNPEHRNGKIFSFKKAGLHFSRKGTHDERTLSIRCRG